MTTRDAAPPVGDPDGDCFVIDQDEETKRMARAAKDQELAKVGRLYLYTMRTRYWQTCDVKGLRRL